jgi:hypothetical protein
VLVPRWLRSVVRVGRTGCAGWARGRCGQPWIGTPRVDSAWCMATWVGHAVVRASPARQPKWFVSSIIYSIRCLVNFIKEMHNVFGTNCFEANW